MLLYVFNRSPGFPLFSTFFLVEKSSPATPDPRIGRRRYAGFKPGRACLRQGLSLPRFALFETGGLKGVRLIGAIIKSL